MSSDKKEARAPKRGLFFIKINKTSNDVILGELSGGSNERTTRGTQEKVSLWTIPSRGSRQGGYFWDDMGSHRSIRMDSIGAICTLRSFYHA